MRTLLALSLLVTVSASAQETSTLRGLAQLKDFSVGRAGSYDRSGGNADRLQLKPGEAATLAEIQGPGEINHMWFTIASGETYHLKKLVLRMYWDGETTPSVEAPIGDFFGLGLGEYVDWQSLPMNVAPLRSLNSYWSMPFARSAKLQQDVLPALRVAWIDAEIQAAAVTAVLAMGRRGLSLVDCSSFEVMRRRGIVRAFHFDRHFRQQGFEPV